ncbi:MAG: hypothetical protein WCO22_10575, partial [Betaproteobacteria bacterium]
RLSPAPALRVDAQHGIRYKEIYKELSNDDRNKADSLVKAVSMGFEPAGMSVAVDLLETL